jgi:hypothetical protein
MMNFSEEQLKVIMKGLSLGIDVSPFADPKFYPSQMEEILKGLMAGVDVSIYADSRYNRDQMEVIRIGLEDGFDVSSYANPDMDFKTMVRFYVRIKRGEELPRFLMSW